jgi:hypothetical protein
MAQARVYSICLLFLKGFHVFAPLGFLDTFFAEKKVSSLSGGNEPRRF